MGSGAEIKEYNLTINLYSLLQEREWRGHTRALPTNYPESQRSEELVQNLCPGIERLIGNGTEAAAAAIVVPVNAQLDLDKFFNLLEDLAEYRGPHHCEIIAIINNYPPENQPETAEILQKMGIRVIGIPDVRIPGETVSTTAKVPGIMAASSENIILFDADCRIPDITAVLNFYIESFKDGYQLIYSPVNFFDLPDGMVIRIRVWMHHFARSLKRNILKIPTPRGSNFAINRGVFLQLYETGRLRDDIQIGPNVKAAGCRYRYSGAKELTVLTSGRRIRKSWLRIFRYIYRRLMFNVRYMRDTDAAHKIHPPDHLTFPTAVPTGLRL